MITRRKLATVLASALGTIGIGAGSATAAPTLAGVETSEFLRLQKWFRDHPELLWAHPSSTPTELLRQKAVRLSEPFAEAHPHIEYDAWVDNCTDNVLLKIYHCRSSVNGESVHLGLGFAITRKAIRDSTPAELDAHITEGWQALTAAVNGDTLPDGWQGGVDYGRWNKKILGSSDWA